MTQPPAPPLPSPSRRLPPPSWPVWLAFGLLLVPGLLVLGLLGGAKDAATERLAFQQDAVDRSVVLTGTLVDVEINPGLPTATGMYSVTIPDAGGGDGETLNVPGDQHWGFPPSPDFPAELDFLVVLDDPPRSVESGPVGTISPVTAESVQDAQNDVGTRQTVWVVGIVVFWLLFLGLPTLAVVLLVRRRRATFLESRAHAGL